jgi:hypothetical protein
MIQRIQSIYLFLCSLGFGGQFVTDLAYSNQPIPNFLSDQKYEIQDSPILLGITVIGILASLAAIFVYNNRPLQQKLSILTIIASLFIPLVAMLLIYTEKTGTVDFSQINDDLGLYLCILPIIFGILAYRCIGKDETLVRSMDRLR